MTDRRSVFVLIFRYFVTVFVITFLMSLFWNVLSGSNMFPFSAVMKYGTQHNPSRQQFVRVETIQKVLDACPNAEWRLLAALSRFEVQLPDRIGRAVS